MSLASLRPREPEQEKELQKAPEQHATMIPKFVKPAEKPVETPQNIAKNTVHNLHGENLQKMEMLNQVAFDTIKPAFRPQQVQS
jgi:hypothetical protein